MGELRLLMINIPGTRSLAPVSTPGQLVSIVPGPGPAVTKEAAESVCWVEYIMIYYYDIL